MEQTPHILVVDDDQEIRSLLAKFFDKHGLRVSTAADGRAMKVLLGERRIDLVILDVMMPGEDGLTLCRNLRATSDVPIIMLTAMGEDMDRILGLEMGADDYLAKPFNPRELLARIKAVLRRGELRKPDQAIQAPRDLYSFTSWTLNADDRALYNGEGEEVTISTGEFQLLLTFVAHPNRVLSRDQLLDFARGRDAQPFDRSIDVQISRLRRKLGDDPKDPRVIKTVRNGGYLFAPKVTRGPANPSDGGAQ